MSEQRTSTYLFKDKEIVDYMMSFQTGISPARQEKLIIKMLTGTPYGFTIDREDIRLATYRFGTNPIEMDRTSLYPSRTYYYDLERDVD